MSWIHRLLINDLGRKILALILATFVWWQVSQSVAEDRTHNFKITVTNQTQTPTNHSIQIHIPSEWELVSPKPGTSIPISFYGSPINLASFFSSQCAATLKPNLEFAPGETTKTIDLLSLHRLTWLKPSEANQLLKDMGSQSFRRLRFERKRQEAIVLAKDLVTVKGKPADGYNLQLEEISFEPNQVSLSGPYSAVEEVLQQIEALRMGFPGAGIFSELEIPLNRRDTLKGVIRLRDTLTRRGVRIFPAQVNLNLPIRLKATAPIVWVPEKNDLQAIGKSAEGEWTISSWSPTPWVASLEDTSTLDVPFDEGWIRKHIVLLLPLQKIPVGAVDNYELSIGWHLIGIENDSLRQKLLSSLRVHPQNEENRLVPMKLLGENL